MLPTTFAPRLVWKDQELGTGNDRVDAERSWRNLEELVRSTALEASFGDGLLPRDLGRLDKPY